MTTWYWIGDTVVNSVDVGDVDGDGDIEIVTGGWYYDGSRDNAQLAVWDGSTLTLERVKTWFWVGDTWINSVVIGDVDNDKSVEIVTGGSFLNGPFRPDVNRYAQLAVWDGATLSLEDVMVWYWVHYTTIKSVAIGDVDGDGFVEIVAGGSYWRNFWDEPEATAQICVWDGVALTLEDVTTWHWRDYDSDTWVQSVDVADVDGDGSEEIVMGGYYYDYSYPNTAQLIVWDSTALSLDDLKTWYWEDYTRVYSVACYDVDDDGRIEIVTGGYFYDGTRTNAQLTVWEMHA